MHFSININTFFDLIIMWICFFGFTFIFQVIGYHIILEIKSFVQESRQDKFEPEDLDE